VAGARTGPSGDAEWQEFVNCLTTNLTSFFREEHHFHAWSKTCGQRASRPLRIWCNAASTGEEPYSIAMTVVETLGSQAPCARLQRHRHQGAGHRAARRLRRRRPRPVARSGCAPLPARHRRQRRLIRVKPGAGPPDRVPPFNLMSASWSGAGGLGEPFDIVFCRNVMIYFDNPTQRKVLERIHGVR
jgi:chemotaxis protein methyltransferase CheR